ncbi:hypothetical protein DPEC_G00166800 [Dallia pectoralis]|uniref:Uncharacterized protein n=1 Tax=Dallia pectoralis TaxID=75939 RepID=A0ACC2GI85_DALPE|nr:hypothetical protein DPEC_G00166800 [Dallia pectoralis]
MHRKPNKSPNQTFFLKLILSLAVSDSLSLSTIPFAIYLLVNEWTFDLWTCGLFTYALYCCLYGSVLTVTLMGVHRHRAMNNKTRNQMGQTSKTQRQKRLHNMMLLGLWVLVCVLALPTMFTREVEEKRGKWRCQRGSLMVGTNL